MGHKLDVRADAPRGLLLMWQGYFWTTTNWDAWTLSPCSRSM